MSGIESVPYEIAKLLVKTLSPQLCIISDTYVYNFGPLFIELTNINIKNKSISYTQIYLSIGELNI